LIGSHTKPLGDAKMLLSWLTRVLYIADKALSTAVELPTLCDTRSGKVARSLCCASALSLSLSLLGS